MSNTIRLLLVDDHQVVRLGLRALLSAESDLEVVGEAGTAAEALAQVESLRPEVVLMDVRLPDQSGITACQRIRLRWPEVKVLMLTSFADESLVLEAVDAGAAGYVLKQVGTDDLIKAVRTVAQGDAVLDPAVTQKLLAHVRRTSHEAQSAAFRDLSEREVQVLAQVAEGKTNAEIGAILMLSEKTVRNHVSTILDKLVCTNRSEAAAYAVRNHVERYTHEV
jgi:two-component system, NarL family, response regulator DevR